MRTTFSAPCLRASAAITVCQGIPGFRKLDGLDRPKIVVANPIWPNLHLATGSNTEIPTVACIFGVLRALEDGKAEAFVGDPITTAAALDRLTQRQTIDLSGPLDPEAPLAFAVPADLP